MVDADKRRLCVYKGDFLISFLLWVDSGWIVGILNYASTSLPTNAANLVTSVNTAISLDQSTANMMTK